MNSLIHKQKKIFMVAGIVFVCVLLASVRWFLSYSPLKRNVHKNQDQQAEQANNNPSVRSFLCKKVKFVDNLVLTGTLQGGARVELRFNREGKINKMNYHVGDKVKKGSVIAELDTAEANIRLQQAESELTQAVEMYRSGAIAKPRLTQAQLAAQLAREEYSRSFIKASRDGSMGEINAQAGEYVNSQMTVATLVSVETVFVEMGVIEKDLGKLHQGQTVKVEVETYPGVTFEGKITDISPIVEGTSRTRTVRAEIPNDKNILLPGMFARAKIFIMEKPDTMVIPATALHQTPEQVSVYTIENGKAKSVPIKLGYESTDYVEVLSGLNDGEKIIAQITEKIRDGIKVDSIEDISYSDGEKTKT